MDTSIREVTSEAALEEKLCLPPAPGGADAEARCIDGVTGIHAEKIAREDLRLELRLPVTAHAAVAHHPSVVEGGDGGNQGVERPPARLQRVHGLRVEGERHAAVLPADAGGRLAAGCRGQGIRRAAVQ